MPLQDGEEKNEIKLEGLNIGNANIDAVFVTHYHGDHIGMYNQILSEVPIYIGEDSKEIFKILQKRLFKLKKISEEELLAVDRFETFKIPEKIVIKDIIITPIEVDHSAFNAHMFLIECDGKKLLHTGDFRTHGQRGKAVKLALKKYVGEIDCLVCEGTTLSRKKVENHTEFDIQYKAEKIFKENKYNFVLCSSTNIDRIAAIHKAALKANRFFVCDDYQKDILMYIDKISRSSLYKFKGKVCSFRNNLLPIMDGKGFVMLVRANWQAKQIMEKFQNSNFIYSQWDGYLDKKFKEYKYLQDFVHENFMYLHTSGHADYETLKSVCLLVNPKIIIPIHSENPKGFEDMQLENCEIKLIKDGEEIEI